MLCVYLDFSDVLKANNSISTVELVQEAKYCLIITCLHLHASPNNVSTL